MTNISKQKLDDKTQEKLFTQFSNLFANKNNKIVTALLEDILTPSEKIMLLKRVAIILMLAEEFSTYKIAKTLKVSDSTVRGIKKRYKDREFNSLLNSVNKSAFDKEKFWETLEVLLRLGMPPMGKGRWSYLNKQDKLYRG